MKLILIFLLSFIFYGCQTFDYESKLTGATAYHKTECRGDDNVFVDIDMLKPAAQDYYYKLDYDRKYGVGMNREKMCKKLEKEFGLGT